MKKIILGLLLVLGTVSFAVPKYVNTAKLQNAGYEITTDDEDIFSYGKATKEAGISIALYPVTDTDSKAISDANQKIVIFQFYTWHTKIYQEQI